MFFGRNNQNATRNDNSTNDLVVAVMMNDVEKIINLLQIMKVTQKASNYEIPTTGKFLLDKRNLTLLHVAAYANATEAFIYLHEIFGIPLNVKNSVSMSVVYYAVYGGSLEIFDYIISKWQEEGHEMTEFYEEDYNRRMETESYGLLYLAAFSQSPEILRHLFGSGYSSKRAKCAGRKKYELAFEYACKNKNIEFIEILLKNSSNNQNMDTMSPLMLAIRERIPDTISFILSNSRPEDLCFYTPTDCQTALSLACLNNDIAIAHAILEKCHDIDIPSNLKAAGAIHWCCQTLNPELVEAFISKGIDVNRLDNNGCPGPYYSIDRGSGPEAATAFCAILNLVTQAGFSVNTPFKCGCRGTTTMLGEVVTSMSKPPAVIRWLLEHGASLEALVPGTVQVTIAKYIEARKNSATFRDIYKEFVVPYIEAKRAEEE